eukprot:2466372-Karenia_brevis.AAC.1
MVLILLHPQIVELARHLQHSMACTGFLPRIHIHQWCAASRHGDGGHGRVCNARPVSYTHLTLPTICSV